MPSHINQPSVCFVFLLACWAGGGGHLHSAQSDSGAGELQRLIVDESGDRIVVTLVADRPLDGVLQRIDGPHPRVFVDLQQIVPRVDRATDVSRGAVRMVRVGLNQPEPPVTRVVLDLEGGASSVLEQGTNSRELRITVVAATPAMTPPASTAQADQYEMWFGRITDTMSNLLAQDARMRPGAANGLDQLEELALAWTAARHELDIVEPPAAFAPAHALLVTAGALGQAVISSRRDGSLTATDAWAANAGAAMLVQQARAHHGAQPRSLLDSP